MEPIRRCVACRRTAPKRFLVRLVVARGDVAVDPGARAPGRGAYLCGRAGCTDLALRRGGLLLRRALHAPDGVSVDGHLREVVQQHRTVTGDGEEQQTERRADGGRDRAGPPAGAGGARPEGAPSQVVA